MRGKQPLKSACLVLIAAVILLGAIPANADVIFASNPGTNQILKFTNGVASVFATTSGNYPEGLAFDKAGNLYVALAGANVIEKYTPGGVRSIFASTGLSSPYGLAFDSQGNLYAANDGTGWIEKFAPNGNASAFVHTKMGVRALAIDQADNVFAGSWQAQYIEKFTPNGTESIWTTTLGFVYPESMAFDSVGNLFVAYGGTQMIEKFSTGGSRSDFANIAPRTPYGLAIGSGDTVYCISRDIVHNTGGSIQDYDAFGATTLYADTGTSWLGFLAVQPAPEPCSLALLVLGAVAMVAKQRART